MSSSTATASEYDIVKVDLSDGRDYPIYIGDSFSEDEAGKLLRSHIKGNRALLITNDKISPMYLEKYESMLKEEGTIQVGTFMIVNFKDGCIYSYDIHLIHDITLFVFRYSCFT
jgi:3-dehydroquinate synthase